MTTSPTTSVVRIFKLLHLLLSKSCTRREIFQELSAYTNNRMFERDLELLQEIGYTIAKKFVSEQGRPHLSYHIVPESGPGLLALSNDQDVEVLRLILLLTQNPGPPLPFKDIIQSLLVRQAKTLFTSEPDMFHGNSYSIEFTSETLLRLLQAIGQKKQVQLEDKQPRDPLYIAFLDMKLLLVCWNHEKQHYEEIYIEKIQEVLVLDQKAENHVPTTLRFWVEKDQVKYAAGQHWVSFFTEHQETTLQDERLIHRVLIKASGYIQQRILTQILELGPYAELLEPLELREEIIRAIKATYQMYAIDEKKLRDEGRS